VLSVNDAIELDRGWIILDIRAHRIHLLNHDGEVVRSIGREGEGPGELDLPRALVVDPQGFGVVDVRGSRLDRFSADGDYLETRLLSSDGCLQGGTLVAASGSPDDDAPLFLAFRCASGVTGVVSMTVERITPDGTTTQVGGRRLFDLASGDGGVLSAPLFSERNGTVAFGSSTDPCLTLIDATGDESTVCHPHPEPVPLPIAERLKFDSLATALEARLPGSRLPTPEVLPFIEAVFLSPSGLFVRRVLGTHARLLERIGPGMDQAVRLMIPPHDASWVGNNSVLAIWETETGTAIGIFPLAEGSEAGSGGAG